MTCYPRTGSRGFVLIELLVVVTILAIMFGTMTPLFRNSYTNLSIRNAYKDIAATVRHAQERAIMEEREFRVNFDEREGMYWLSYRDDPMQFPAKFVTLDTDEGAPRLLPEGVAFRNIVAKRDKETRAHYITFYPSGTADKATVRLRDTRYRSFIIETGRETQIIMFKERH